LQVDDEQHGNQLLWQQRLDLRRQVTHHSRQERVALQVVGVQRVRDAQLRLVSPGVNVVVFWLSYLLLRLLGYF
jgi:hypothetical protein